MKTDETKEFLIRENGREMRATQELFPAPIGQLLGLTIVRDEDGKAAVEFEATENHANPMGTLHGGVLCDLADAAMGVAYRSTLAPGESFTTLELKINFLRPVWKAILRAEARVVSAGNTVGLIECDILDPRGRLVARASSTCLRLRGAAARGRELNQEAQYTKENGERQDLTARFRRSRGSGGILNRVWRRTWTPRSHPENNPCSQSLPDLEIPMINAMVTCLDWAQQI